MYTMRNDFVEQKFSTVSAAIRRGEILGRPFVVITRTGVVIHRSAP